MNIIEHKNEIEIIPNDDFDPIKIFECGQCFRWNADETGTYTGIVKGHVAHVRKNSKTGNIQAKMIQAAEKQVAAAHALPF